MPVIKFTIEPGDVVGNHCDWECPIARALYRTTGQRWRVNKRLYNASLRRSIPIPEDIKEWAMSHDRHEKPELRSFSFEF